MISTQICGKYLKKLFVIPVLSMFTDVDCEFGISILQREKIKRHWETTEKKKHNV